MPDLKLIDDRRTNCPFVTFELVLLNEQHLHRINEVFLHVLVEDVHLLSKGIDMRCLTTRCNHIVEFHKRFSKKEYIWIWRSYTMFSPAQFPPIFGHFYIFCCMNLTNLYEVYGHKIKTKKHPHCWVSETFFQTWIYLKLKELFHF